MKTFLYKRTKAICSCLVLALAGFSACTGDDDGNKAKEASECGSDAALSTCLQPQQTPEYYIEQSSMYFDTLDADASRDSIPNYSELVARWEWPPWLKLTGIGRDIMIQSDLLVIELTPSTVPQRDCRAFDVQPFGRCRVSFLYSGGPCPIYEEFTFNDQGEITFIEAWSDQPGMLPFADESDLWGERPGVRRLSTILPGLGNETGLIDLDSAAMTEAALQDADIADFVNRAQNFYTTWAEELAGSNGGLTEEEIYGYGCGW